jgi:acyl-CoA reductase-like NAD-dependent aldehyde dehydrogenase
MIVTGSAKLDEVIDAVVRGGFYANGQACIAIQRLIVLEDVDASFEDRLREAVANVQVGDPWDANTDVAALIDKAARDRVVGQIDDALRHGARKLAETPILTSSGAPPETLVVPQVLVDVPDDHLLWEEEIFAPVVCLRRVRDFNEAIRVANNSRYGLQASIYTSDLAEAHVAIDSLEVGGVVVNQVPGFRSDVMPYGGFKDSGVGREGPRWAAKEYTATRMALVRIPKN